ncbi:MAG: ABC transporter ATP-binding protein [Rhodocyclaceae bacterium]
MTPAKPVSIVLRGCAKTFSDGTRALEPLDLTIAAGETVVLLGPSGCGKTTTLRMIAGLEMPDAGGQVLFDGEDVTRIPIERRKVGMVFQSYALFPNMTLAENVGYGLRLQKLPAREVEARVGEMLAMMRLGHLATRRVDQLSGGQRQRVALARALAVRPRALLLDEPLTALDAKLRDALRLEIDTLLRELGVTAVYVTHDQAEAMALGDRIVVMDHGRIAQAGTPAEIYRRPANRFVADFVGAMNRLSGRMRDGCFVCAAGRVPVALAPDTQEILFRPEAARLLPADAPAGEPAGAFAWLQGRVASAFYLGDRSRVFIDVGESAPILIETADPRTFRHGETVRFSIDPDALVLIEEASSC